MLSTGQDAIHCYAEWTGIYVFGSRSQHFSWFQNRYHNLTITKHRTLTTAPRNSTVVQWIFQEKIMQIKLIKLYI